MENFDRLLRRREVERRTGLGRSSLYQLIADRKFPAPVRISAKAVAWRQSEIAAWIAERPSARSEAA